MIEYMGMQYADHAVQGVGELVEGEGNRLNHFSVVLAGNHCAIYKQPERRQEFIDCIRRTEKRMEATDD